MGPVMRLADYLTNNSIKRIDFAARVGVSPQTITGWCDGTFWPSKKNVERVVAETDGAVTPNDFMVEAAE